MEAVTHAPQAVAWALLGMVHTAMAGATGGSACGIASEAGGERVPGASGGAEGLAVPVLRWVSRGDSHLNLDAGVTGPKAICRITATCTTRQTSQMTPARHA